MEIWQPQDKTTISNNSQEDRVETITLVQIQMQTETHRFPKETKACHLLTILSKQLRFKMM